VILIGPAEAAADWRSLVPVGAWLPGCLAGWAGFTGPEVSFLVMGVVWVLVNRVRMLAGG